MGHTWPISKFKFNPSFYRKQTPWSNFNLFPIFNTQHGMSHSCPESAATICGSYWHLRLNCDCQRGTQWIAKLKTVYSSIRCVCVCVCVRNASLVKGSEVTKLYTWSTRNSTCFSKHINYFWIYKTHHFKSGQNIKIIAIIDLYMMLWLLSWICSAVSWKCSNFHVKTENSIVLKTSHNCQKTYSSTHSQILLNI